MADRPTWVGKTLGGRYRIDDILGQGGMSAVYKTCWNVADPAEPAANCWLPGDLAFFHGDRAAVPVLETGN